MKALVLILFLSLSGMTGHEGSGNDFDRMKTLAGEWESTGPEGKSRVKYEVISNGTALMETMVNENMMTIYHPDGASLLLTHYCSAGNEPRMRAKNSGGKGPIAFQLVDVANLKAAQEGHMKRLVIKFQDADHVTQEWTWKEKGKETTSAFHLQRVK